MSTEASNHEALKHIDLMLNKHGRHTKQFGLPKVTHDKAELDRLISAFNADEMNTLSQQLVPQLTQEQRTIFD